MQDLTKEKIMSAGKFLGTLAPFPLTLPEEVARAPLDSHDAVTKTYCGKCSGIAEIGEGLLGRILDLRATLLNIKNDIPMDVRYWSKHYVLFPDGCPNCRPDEMPTITIVSFGDAEPAS